MVHRLPICGLGLLRWQSDVILDQSLIDITIQISSYIIISIYITDDGLIISLKMDSNTNWKHLVGDQLYTMALNNQWLVITTLGPPMDIR